MTRVLLVLLALGLKIRKLLLTNGSKSSRRLLIESDKYISRKSKKKLENLVVSKSTMIMEISQLASMKL